MMATYDNKVWLLKNIRNAFIATDDTGLCEIVMAGENFSKIYQNKAIEEKKRIREDRLNVPSTSKGIEIGMGDISEEEEDKEIVTQFDPYPDLEDSDEDDLCGSYMRNEDFGGHRQRSNYDAREKKEQALRKAAKTKIIKWEDPPLLTKDQLALEFTMSEIKKPEKFKSLLAKELETCPYLPHRQYLEYAKFDGTAQLGLPTKSFKIFMTMLPEKHQNYPIVVCVIASAKIRDLIGFTCYKYSIEHPDISLGSVHEYGLCMAEDDGEVDWGFPCLDANEPCSKFGFTCLGLVELKCKNAHPSDTNSIPDECGLMGFQMFRNAADSGQSQMNMSRHNTGGSATSDAVICALQAMNERRGAGDAVLVQSHILAAEAPQYKTYRVHLIRKVRTNILVQLSVCLDRVEVEPLVPHKFWSRAKYFLHTIDSVVWCQILEVSNNKTTFRMVYSPTNNGSYGDRNISGVSFFQPNNTSYKHHDFECDHDTAKEIVDKVNTILDLRDSPCRREYKSIKEKKMLTRRSTHNKHVS